MEHIEELYRKYGDPRKTMQEHHWIEQSRIRNTEKYPFLGCPPMKEDLLKSDKNLSLIVGHNGGHKNTYNRLLDKKLGRLKDILENLCIENNVKMNELINDEKITNMINSQVSKIIGELQDALKKDHKIMNNVEKMFILD